jgi:hypothetical protein
MDYSRWLMTWQAFNTGLRGYNAAPIIVRTRGHRLEGIWHSGSPMGNDY